MDRKTQLLLGGAGVALAAGVAITGASLADATPQSVTAVGYAYGAPGGSAPGGAQGGAPTGNGNTDPSKPMRSDETLLTGDAAAKVTAAAKAKEPTATIERVETDSDGVYEAHMVRTDGTKIIVQIDKSYSVTNVIVGGQGGPGGHGGAGGQTPSGTPSASAPTTS